MKIFTLILFFHSLVFAKISIISDLDETIKRTHSKHPVGIYNGLFTQNVYADIPLVINELLKSEEVNDLHILSASPKAFSLNIKKLLKKYSLKYKTLTLRNMVREPSKFDYKYSVISKILKSSKDSFLLIGDNLGNDPEIYAQIAKDFPGRIEKIFIHKVVNKDIAQEVEVYFTSFELAVFNKLDGLLSNHFTEKIGSKLLASGELKEYFPKQVFCPSRMSEFNTLLSKERSKLTEAITQKITSFCY